MAAKEKQRLVKERFKGWVFSDADRTERLVRVYNDTYNNLRPRIFDGSHLDFPGKSRAITLNPHQEDAVWRCMSGGNTLMAHTVGAGKTITSCASAMKMKQAGLVKKPMLVVPNHMLEQFSREFLQLYPNARLLVAGKDDFTKERRKALTAKIATGDWDGIIVTHSGFERIGMSKEYQERFLREQIEEYEGLLLSCAGEGRNIIKQIEKGKARREERLKELLAEDKKDSGLVFDELGVDQVFVDECFTYDTLIDTNRGALKIGDIVTNRLHVCVKSVNSSTHAVEWKPVVNWFANKRRNKLVEVVHETGSIRCTPSHKLFTGLVTHRKAGEIEAGETLLVLQESIPPDEQMFGKQVAEVLLGGVPTKGQDGHGDLRVVRDDIHLSHAGPDKSGETSAAFLLRELQDAGSTGESGDRSQVSRGHAPPLGRPVEQGSTKSGGCPPDEIPQSDVLRGDAGANFADAEVDGAHAARSGWQRAPIDSADVARRKNGDEDRTCGRNQGDKAPDPQVREVLQGRLGRFEPPSHRRSGWQHAQLTESTGDRCEEGESPVASRVVSVTVLEPGSDGEYRFGGRDHSVVYDIEVADNHNYFANGVLVSNCHAFKNLEAPSKMERVAGIQTGGSERAFDLFMKVRYLDEIHPGHGIVGMSGTPISNSMVEMYTMQRFFDPKGLEDRGIGHLDGWAATFGEVVESMEISPDGSTLKPRSRFAKFINLPELTQMFRAFSDVQTAEMLDLPRPALAGGKPQTISCPMSEEQAELQAALVKRYERIRNERVDPREDNALNITTDGRKLALDARMLSPLAEDCPESKINALVANVARIHRETTPKRATQMIFCDMGVNARPFSAYDEVVSKLERSGIPPREIAVMGDADTDAKKRALFEAVRAGTVRVLIGSTQKMGTGTNVQKRLVALHHLDAPWKPAEVEQREGRILRQGNMNPEVSIFRYVTEGSFDAYMWQALETKARFIAQVMRGDCGSRSAEDIGGQELSYAEVKAIASGNPAVLTLAEADAEMQRLAVIRRNHADEQYMARRNIRELPDAIERLEKRIAALDADRATVEEGRSDTQEQIARRLERIPDKLNQSREFTLGTYRGLELGLIVYPFGGQEVVLEGKARRRADASSQGVKAVTNAAERICQTYPGQMEMARQDAEVARGKLEDYKERLGRPFVHESYMSQLSDLRDRLKQALSDRPPEGVLPSSEMSERIKALRATVKVEDAPKREARASVAEVPVTRRIRRQPVIEVVEAPPEPPAPELPRQIVLPPMPEPSFRQKVRGRQADPRQMTMW